MTTRGETDALFYDDFPARLEHDGPGARWQLRPAAGLPEGDATAIASPAGLVVEPREVNPDTGLPQFSRSPGATGHVRWAALARHTCGHGFPGFDAPEGRALTLSAELAVRAYGLARHPYGTAVADPHRDPGLAAAALITTDRETGMVFDFTLTDACVYAVYERLGQPDPEAAAFSYAVPVAERGPGLTHRLAIAYRRGEGTVTWMVDDREVLTVDRIGLRALDPGYLTRDNHLTEKPAAPRQLTIGLGLFADEAWGQGIRLTVQRVGVS
jgi:hypothetical protein